MNHEDEFAESWDEPNNTRFESRQINVNQVLAGRYRTGMPLTLTRAMLWDAEVRKARQPDIYLPDVVQNGSAAVWNTAGNGTTFDRSSMQRRWLEPDEFGLVLERVHLDAALQRATFIGAAELPGPDGATLSAARNQPLFNVEHALAGDNSEPLNLWRIVHLTPNPDHRLVEAFINLTRNPWLPSFVEIYIRSVLNIELERSPTGYAT